MICDLLVSRKSLPVFVLLIFSTSSVSKLWVCSTLELFLFVGPFGSMQSLIWSSIRISVLFEGMCSLVILVCRESRWISWTRNHVFHHSHAFSSLIFFVSFWVNWCVYPLLGLFRTLLVLLLNCLSIQPFCYFFSFHILVQNRMVSFASGCWYVFVSSSSSSW